MTERVIDISEIGADLRVRNRQLVIRLSDDTTEIMPMDDLGVVVSAHPRTTFSQAVLAELLRQGGAFIISNEKCLPVGMLLPLETNYIQAERMAAQANVKLPVKKRLWQQIVMAKIKAQSRLLHKIRKTDGGIGAFARKVKSGDPDNYEAQAAQQYWGLLFDDPTFRRDFQADDQNRLLNYGYAILRAIVARGLAAAGLHPSLGIHHHNRYNPFCLADDVMEPMRPLVDEIVVEISEERGAKAPLDKLTKAQIIDTLQGKFSYHSQLRTLFDAANHLGATLAGVYMGSQAKLEFATP